METRASYLLVGTFVLVLLAGTLGFLVWLVGGGGGVASARYDVIYEGSVTGLREGSPVRLNGVKVGDVVYVDLVKGDPSKVRIGLSLREDAPVSADTRASLELEGLTGGRYVLLTGGSPQSPPLQPTPGEEYPLIVATPSPLDQVLQDAPTVLANINELLSRGNRLLSDRNLDNISKSFEDLATITDAFAANRDRVESILVNVDETLQSLKTAGGAIEELTTDLRQDAANLISSIDGTFQQISKLAGQLNETFDAVDDDVRRLVGKVSTGVDSFSSMAGEISKLVAENREPLRDFTAQGLFELVNFLAEARELVSSLRKITTDVERDPARFLFGDQQEGYEPGR